MDTVKKNEVELDVDNARKLGLLFLSKQQRKDFYADIGLAFSVLILSRLSTVLTTEQMTSLEQYIETEPKVDQLMQHISEHYLVAQEIIAEELNSLHTQFE